MMQSFRGHGAPLQDYRAKEIVVMKKLNHAIIIISKIVEVFMWVGCGLSAVITGLSAAGRFGSLKHFTDVSVANAQVLNSNNFSLVVRIQDGVPNRGSYVLFFLTMAIVFVLMAMIARNVHLIFKTSEGKTSFSQGVTPFQPDNVRMVREIGIFTIAIEVVQFIMSIVARIALGPDMVESSLGMQGVFIGLVMLALSQYFAYGMKLQNDVDGLL